MGYFLLLLFVVSCYSADELETEGVPAAAPHLELMQSERKQKRTAKAVAPIARMRERKAKASTVKRPKVSLSEQLVAAKELAERVLPAHLSKRISFLPLKVESGSKDVWDAFELESPSRGHLQVFASSGVAAASGLRYFLSRFARASISWGRDGTGVNVAHLDKLPTLEGRVRKQTKQKYRYYFNAVTFGYSSAFWDWERWQIEIDWAAMHGINLFLALEGQEYVWEKLWKEMGVSQEDLEKYFPGPAFLAWHRMGNLDEFAGPQPRNWRYDRFVLQKQIVARMRSLGIVPVLTAFAGHIPQALEKVFEAKGEKLKVHRGKDKESGWCGFDPTTILDASDPMFRVIGKRFLQLQEEAFGTDSIYSCDTWNEMKVPSTDAEFLRASSRGVIDGMLEADPDAVWLMQGWLFLFSRFWYPERIEAYLSGVSNDRMIVLDLFAEKRSMWDETNSFYGKPWIWCQLLNFGGNHGLYGNMTRVAVEPARAFAESSSFSGTGMSMECIERNVVLFEMLADTVWTDKPLDVSKWLMQYVQARYRFNQTLLDSHVHPAWLLLNSSVYHWNGQLVKSLMEERPKFPENRMWKPPQYFPENVAVALEKILQAIDKERALSKKDFAVEGPLKQDLVDLARQVLVDVFSDLVILCRSSVAIRDLKGGEKHHGLQGVIETMMQLLDDLDEVLATDINFMFGVLLEEAKKTGGAGTEFQVRNINTMWGDGVILNDYASKQMSGMVKDYYKQRWKLYLSKIEKLEANYVQEVYEMEVAFANHSKREQIRPTGDSLTSVSKALDKYAKGKVNKKNYAYFKGCYPTKSSQLHQAWTTRSGTLELMCDLLPWCGGFTTTGMLFMTHGNMEGSSAVKSDCYLKKKELKGVKPEIPKPAVAAAKKARVSVAKDAPVVGNEEDASVERATVAIASGVIVIVAGVLALSLATYLLFLATQRKKLK